MTVFVCFCVFLCGFLCFLFFCFFGFLCRSVFDGVGYNHEGTPVCFHTVCFPPAALTRPKVSLVFLGDSITEGYRGTDFGRAPVLWIGLF